MNLIGVLEAAYTRHGDERGWLAGMLQAIAAVWAAEASIVAHVVSSRRSRHSHVPPSVAQATREIERTRGPLRPSSPDETLALWRALVAGHWAIIDLVDADGRRYLVARKKAPSAATLDALSPREREVLAHAALGHTNKLIAYELGIAVTTVASALAAASHKVGVRSRAELIRLYQATSKGSP